MLKTFFNQYKLYVYLVLVIVWSGFVWTTATHLQEAKAVKQQLAQAEKFIQVQVSNDKLKQDLSKLLVEQNTKQRAELKAATKELLNDVLKDPVYKSCLVTDSVRNALKRKLDSQGK